MRQSKFAHFPSRGEECSARFEKKVPGGRIELPIQDYRRSYNAYLQPFVTTPSGESSKVRTYIRTKVSISANVRSCPSVEDSSQKAWRLPRLIPTVESALQLSQRCAIEAAMPKPRPLPIDPHERARLLRRRKTVAACVARWRAGHPALARHMWRLSKALQRQRRTVRLRAMLGPLD